MYVKEKIKFINKQINQAKTTIKIGLLNSQIATVQHNITKNNQKLRQLIDHKLVIKENAINNEYRKSGKTYYEVLQFLQGEDQIYNN